MGEICGDILIIEDEKGLVMSLEDRLTAEGYTVSSCGDGIRGEVRALNNKWDLIILDIMLPGKDGFQVCQNIRKQDETTPVLMLTARDTNIDTVMGLRLGADDYLCKPFDMQVLLARIEALLRRSRTPSGTVGADTPDVGGRQTAGNRAAASESSGVENTTAGNRPTGRGTSPVPSPPPLINFGDFVLDTLCRELRRGTRLEYDAESAATGARPPQGRESKNEETVPISAQEYRLLEYLLCNPNRVISRDELLDKVWGYDSVASTRTVDVHVARLRKKLGEETVSRHMHTARGHGYRFTLEDKSTFD